MWLYNDKELVDEDVEGYYGFIYKIENLIDGRCYLGRKYFTKAGTKQVKGKRRKIRKMSDWKDYWGSSPRLQTDLDKFGYKNFTRTILRLCLTRGETNYWEVKLQFQFEVLESDQYYNDNIAVKFTRRNIGCVK